VAAETFISIYSQEVQYKVIKSNHIHKCRVEEYLARWMSKKKATHFGCCVRGCNNNTHHYFISCSNHRYMAGEDLLLLSAAVNFPCCLLLRRMLESLLRVHKQVWERDYKIE